MENFLLCVYCTRCVRYFEISLVSVKYQCENVRVVCICLQCKHMLYLKYHDADIVYTKYFILSTYIFKFISKIYDDFKLFHLTLQNSNMETCLIYRLLRKRRCTVKRYLSFFRKKFVRSPLALVETGRQRTRRHSRSRVTQCVSNRCHRSLIIESWPLVSWSIPLRSKRSDTRPASLRHGKGS